VLTDPAPKLGITNHSTEREISDVIRFSLQRNGKLEERFQTGPPGTIATNYVISNARESKEKEKGETREKERWTGSSAKVHSRPMTLVQFDAQVASAMEANQRISTAPYRSFFKGARDIFNGLF